MADQNPPTQPVQRKRSASGLVAGLAVLVSLAALGFALYGFVRQSSNAAMEIQLPYVMAAGGGAVIAAIVAQIGSLSVWDILEAIWDAITAVFSFIGAVLAGIAAAILGRFG
jgi:phage-related protein